jgi:hypothetical protein
VIAVGIASLIPTVVKQTFVFSPSSSKKPTKKQIVFTSCLRIYFCEDLPIQDGCAALLKVPRRLPVADLAEASFKQIRTKIFTI